MEADLKRKDGERKGKAAVGRVEGVGGRSTIFGFRLAWADFEERILIASVGWR